MDRFGVRIAGQVPDTVQVARLAAPIIGRSLEEVSGEMARSGQLATALSRAQAERLAAQLSDLGLEVFVAGAPREPAPPAQKQGRSVTDPLHGLQKLGLRALSDTVPESGLAAALTVDADELSRPSIGTAPPAFMASPGLGPRIAEDAAYDDADEPMVSQTGVMFAPAGAAPAAPDGPPSGSAFELQAPGAAPVKPPRVRPSQEIQRVRDPFDSDAVGAGLPAPIFSAAVEAPQATGAPSAGAAHADRAPPPRRPYGPIMVALLVIAVGVMGYMLLQRSDDPVKLVAMARDAAASGQYDEALTLVAQARKAGGVEATLRPVVRDAQAGPLLDAVEGHLAARAWAKARAALETARALAPESARVVGLTLRLERLMTGQPAKAATSAQLVISAPATAAPATAAPATAAPATAAPAVATRPPANAGGATAAPVQAARSTPRVQRVTVEAAAAERPRATPEPARLLVRSTVSADIFVDGRASRRRTPTTLKLSPGDHDLELRDIKTGRVLGARSVRAVAGRAARVYFDVAPAARRPVAVPPSARPVAASTRAPGRVEMLGAPTSAAGAPKPSPSRVEMIGQ